MPRPSKKSLSKVTNKRSIDKLTHNHRKAKASHVVCFLMSVCLGAMAGILVKYQVVQDGILLVAAADLNLQSDANSGGSNSGLAQQQQQQQKQKRMAQQLQELERLEHKYATIQEEQQREREQRQLQRQQERAQKIQIQQPKNGQLQADTESKNNGPLPRFVTVLLPSVVNGKNSGQRLQAIMDTWGPQARVVIVVTNLEDFPGAATLPRVSPDNMHSNVFPQLLLLPNDERRENNVPRLKYILDTIYQMINPDFAFFANDHTFVIPEHLCAFLSGKDPNQDMYAGHALQTQEHVFNSGAAGYFLSRQTLSRLSRVWADGTDPHCNVVHDNASVKARFLQKSPGLLLTYCLRNGLGVFPVDTRVDHKYHQFHAFPFTRVALNSVDEWYVNKHTVEMAKVMNTDESYATLLSGPDCCADTTASFHYVEDLETRAFFSTRQKLLQSPAMPDSELKDYMISVWPNKKQAGGYSRELPKTEQWKEWEQILQTIRKVSQAGTTDRTC